MGKAALAGLLDLDDGPLHDHHSARRNVRDPHRLPPLATGVSHPTYGPELLACAVAPLKGPWIHLKDPGHRDRAGPGAGAPGAGDGRSGALPRGLGPLVVRPRDLSPHQGSLGTRGEDRSLRYPRGSFLLFPVNQ